MTVNNANMKPGAESRRNNFLCVASLNSSDHLAYHRDLPMLLELSMKSNEHDLALDLGEFPCFNMSAHTVCGHSQSRNSVINQQTR